MLFLTVCKTLQPVADTPGVLVVVQYICPCKQFAATWQNRQKNSRAFPTLLLLTLLYFYIGGLFAIPFAPMPRATLRYCKNYGLS